MCGDKIRAITIDQNGNLWFGTHSNGVCRYDGKEFSNYNESNGLCYDFVMSMVCDAGNNMWFGTDGGGICKFDGARFRHLTEKDGMAGNLVMAVWEDAKNNLWFGTYGNGVSKYDGQTFTNYKAKDGLCSDLIYDIIDDKNGNLWFVSKGNGISMFDGKKFTNYNTSNGLPSDLVYSVVEDNLGNIWFATLGGGISIYNGKKFTNIGKEQGLSSDYVYSLFEDDDGNMWLGTDDEGVSMIFAECNSNKIIEDGFIDETHIINLTKFGITNKMVLNIVEDKFGNIWIGTFGGGITRFDGVDLKTFSAKDGLNSNNIYLSLIDSAGYLWLGTEKGLNRLDIRENPTTPEIKIYSKPEGFIGIETNFNSCIEDHNKNLWFGNIYGATMYNPREDLPNKNEPILNITDVKLFFKKTDWSEYSDTLSRWGGIPYHLELPYDQNHLTFEFVGIDTRSPKKVTYQWKLEGFDKDWSPRSNKTEVTYQYIPPGKYTFKVKAFNSDGVGNEQPVTFSFRIPPPFWQTWWFYTILVLIGLLLVVIFVRLRLRALEKEKKILEHKVEQRTKELRKEKAIVEQQTEELRAQTDQLAMINKELEKLVIVARETDNSVMIADKNGDM
ncbi:MAG: hypothetical protein C0594_06870 [Marinilabiliales bacterium]|nr:MAG: hypothetical protein C0594_06870 [Marinilabiliales bacterium]